MIAALNALDLATAGPLAMFFAMLFAVVEAADQLGFSQVRDVVTAFIRFSGESSSSPSA